MSAHVIELHLLTLTVLTTQGFRTGYLYRQPLLRNDQQPRTKYDVEIPPSATSGALTFEEDKWLSPLKKLVDGKKTQDKLRWVNSPNMYQKVEMGETGEQDPKKVTKVCILVFPSVLRIYCLSLPCLSAGHSTPRPHVSCRTQLSLSSSYLIV